MQYTVFRTGAETAKGPVLNQNVITMSGSSTQSPTVVDPTAGAANGSRCVRIAVTDTCCVAWGANPVALLNGAGGVLMGADTSTVEYFDMEADDLIAVIERS